MGEYSPQDFYQMRQCYGKWALRYSVVHLGLGISLFFTSPKIHQFIVVLLTLNALISHLHLWPTVHATLKNNFGKSRIYFIFFGLLIVWLMPLIFYMLPEYLKSVGRGGTVFLMFFLGPPITMFEIYPKLEKGREK